MQQQIFDDINQAVSQGVPINMIGHVLTEKGWPKELVDEALGQWLQLYGSTQSKTDAMKEWLKKYYRRAIPAIVLVVGLNLVDTAIALLKPIPVKIMADSVFGDIPAWGPLEPFTGTSELLLFTAVLTVALFVLGTLFGAIRDFFILKVSFWLNRSIKRESLRHILHLPLFHQQRLAKGDYVYRQNVVTDSLADLVLGTTSSIIQSILIIFGVLAIMFNINADLTWTAVVLIPLLFISVRLIGPKMGKYAQKFQEVASETSARINESVNNAEAVQAFSLENKMVKKVDRLWYKSYYYMRKNLVWGELLEGVNGFLVVIATSTVIYLGGMGVMEGRITFGDLIIFITYMGYLIDPVKNLIGQITSRYQKIIDVGRIYEVLTDHEGVEYLRQDRQIMKQVDGSIHFVDVTYGYGDKPVFENLSFSIKAGTRVGIIGPSGGGKSTLLKLVPLFIEPHRGKVFVDDIDTQSVSLKELRKRIAWVSQEPQLFDETIIENLLEGDIYRDVSSEEIKRAVVVSNIAEFVMQMPLAFESPVGEDGGNLSGGQKQRLSIARALVKNAPIVCLDEPTAALDIKSENYIRDSLAEMIKDKTVMMVTHRKPLLDLMDAVYVLENGVLTDVNELGGLSSYLAQLEGIEQQKAEVEIHQESANKEQIMSQLMSLQPEQLSEIKQHIAHTERSRAIEFDEADKVLLKKTRKQRDQETQPLSVKKTFDTQEQPSDGIIHPENDDEDITIDLHRGEN